MAWNDLTLPDKARMINLAVKSGITDLRTIEEVYNKYAEGGPLDYEGFQMPETQQSTYYGPYNEETIAGFQKEIENPSSPQAYKEANLALSRLNSPGKRLYYDPRFPYYEYVTRKDADDFQRKQEIDNKYRIPFIPDKRIVLSNAGPLNGIELSTNMIDSIRKYAFDAQIPLVKAFGIAASETGFGKFPSTTYFTPNEIKDWDESAKRGGVSNSEFVSNGGVNPTDLLNFHNYYNNSYNDAIGAVARKLGKDGEFIHDASNGYINAGIDPIAKQWYPETLDSLFKRGYTYADRKYKAPKDENPLKSAFEFYMSGKWNPGNSLTEKRIEELGRAFMNSKEYKNYEKSKKSEK